MWRHLKTSVVELKRHWEPLAHRTVDSGKPSPRCKSDRWVASRPARVVFTREGVHDGILLKFVKSFTTFSCNGGALFLV